MTILKTVNPSYTRTNAHASIHSSIHAYIYMYNAFRLEQKYIV